VTDATKESDMKMSADMMWHVSVTLDELHADGYTDALFLGWEQTETGGYRAMFQWTDKSGVVVRSL
jgi:hypothetical protein